ncbi:MAG: hypothetical protein AB8H80_08410 [Planctomycetota bacterium]
MQTPFEQAVLAVVDGDLNGLHALLAAHPAIVHERSDDEFGAGLLHHVAANGVPDALQRTPANAVDICRCLLDAGAEPDGWSQGYGGGNNSTPLCLLVSSWWPFAAKLQAPLVAALVQGGARANGLDDDGMPLATALVFGYRTAAEALFECGARVDNILFAAGLGQADLRSRLAPSSDAKRNDNETAALLGSYRSPFGVTPPTTRKGVLQQALHFAVSHSRHDAIDQLLVAGADSNGEVDGHHCRLPLVQALFLKRSATAIHLLSHSADPDRVDTKRNTTARGLARETQLTEFLQALER